jgi:hypothetical protein
LLNTYRKIFVIAGLVCCLFSSAFAKYSGGAGTAQNPYQIANASDLLLLGADSNDHNKCFMLSNDLDLHGQNFTWAIIGGGFTGTFDGNSHRIFNFTINGNGWLGLFSLIEHGGTVKNLNVECTVNGSLGYQYAGCLAGLNRGSISGCYSEGTVNADHGAGGLCGRNEYGGSITNCYSDSGNISGNNSIGGLCGENYYGNITNCYATNLTEGEYAVGGLCGYNFNGNISSCYFLDTAGLDNGQGEPLTDLQMKQQTSFINWDFSDSDGNEAVWIMPINEYPVLAWQGLTPQTKYSGGAGTAQNPYQIANPNDLLVLAADTNDYNKCFILTADIDLDPNLPGRQVFTKAIIAPDTDSSYGYQGTPFTGTFDGNGHKVTHFAINGTSNDYLALFGYVDFGGSVKNLGLENFLISGYQAVAGLCGGNGGSISNCYSMGTVSGSFSVSGLVGENNYGNISNCYSTSAVSGLGYYAGGLVGINSYGVVTNCYSTGAVSGYYNIGGLVGLNYDGTINNCYSTGAVSYGPDCWCIGGLAGYNNGGSISNCYSTGDVSGASNSMDVGGLVGGNNGNISNCYSTSDVSGAFYLGGLAGNSANGSIISNCYSAGTVKGDSNSMKIGGLVGLNYASTISNCYSIGAVSGSSYVGGLVGYTFDSNIINSFWDVNTSGQTISDGGTGKTTAEMKTLSTFTDAGWDFDFDWFIQIDEYPILTWQISPADIYTDGKNNFRDFTVLARFWMRDDCGMYNNYCDGADLNFDGVVDIRDLKELASYWLQSGIYN